MSEDIKTESSGLAPSDEAGKDMHIHKPKAAHSLREFASEIGVIVVGVLIALALEQGVEWMRMQSDIVETRETLLAEMSQNATSASVAEIEDRCLLASARNWAAWARGGAKPALKTGAYTAYMHSTAWDLAKTGVVDHMPMKERMAIAEYYGSVKNYNDNMQRLRGFGLEVVGIKLLERLNDSEARDLLKHMNATSVLISAEMMSAGNLIEDARALGAKPKPISPADRGHLEKLCREVGAPQYLDPNVKAEGVLY